jgi:hypothetical protein
MPPITLTFRLLTKCQKSENRGIGFLEGHGELNAGSAFDGFTGTILREMRSHMDQWLDGRNGPKQHFHNFKNEDPEHRNCFEFRYREHRLYGFLCHPDGRPRFQVCALCIYTTKFKWESDRAELDRVEQWYRIVTAHKAISMAYPTASSQSGGKKQWTQ